MTIDNYRIAAKQQIETYAEIMRIPVACVESAVELEKYLALCGESDLILVDTIGRSPRDLEQAGRDEGDPRRLPAAHGEIHLALSATTKASDVEEILRPVRAVRLPGGDPDEARRDPAHRATSSARSPGTGKPVAYSATGRAVPQDIEEATVLRLLMNMEGFRCARERLETNSARRAQIADGRS